MSVGVSGGKGSQWRPVAQGGQCPGSSRGSRFLCKPLLKLRRRWSARVRTTALESARGRESSAGLRA
eukprot:scaffold141_cov410-Prasinococcus_capsulatus_cf.AAC.11